MNVEKKTKASFKDMVMGNKQAPAARPRVDLFQEKLAKIEYENGNPQKPMVHIADTGFEGLYAPWKDALVVSLLGKSIGYNTMKERLTRLWKLMACFEIMDMGNGYYMVKFEEEADRIR